MKEDDLILYMVYHDDTSHEIAKGYAHKYSWVRPLFLPSTRYMESYAYILLKDLQHEWKDKKYVGMIKYSFENKAPWYDFHQILEETGTDVLAFVGSESHGIQSRHTSMIAMAEGSHPMFCTIWTHILKTRMRFVGNIFSDEIPAFYSNSWIARCTMFQEYLHFFANAYHVMENDPIIHSALMFDAQYYCGQTPLERVKEIMGVPYYTHHAFIAERLPCFYFWAINAKIHIHISKERYQIQKEWEMKHRPMET